MDNRDKNNPELQDDWFDQFLKDPAPAPEIEPDQQAIKSAKLRHPDELDIENILAEDWSEPQEEIIPEELLSTPQPVNQGEIPAEPQPTAQEEVMVDSPKDMVEEVFEEEIAEEITQQEPSPVQKGRPMRKKGSGLLGIPHLLSAVIWLALILAVGIALGRILWVCCADIMAFGKPSQEITITITEKDNISSISKKLGKANLIRYPQLFQFFAEVTGKDEDISVGTFTLNSHLDYNAMINSMGSYGAARQDVDILFPEGYNCAQIFKLLEENDVCTVAELEEYAANGELSDYWFLEGVKRGDKYCLEGYLAPDTYTFYTNDEPKRVLEKFLDEFDDRFSDILKENLATMQERYNTMLAANGYGEDFAKEHPLTLHAALTIASMVQKEMANDTECYDIASAFYNRVTNPGEYPYLDSDATVYYAIGDYFGDTEELSAAQLATDSPYNTRNHQGLPPGPICNPGIYALYAALEPNETDYHYFVYDPEIHEHRFSSTYSQHLSLLEEMGL